MPPPLLGGNALEGRPRLVEPLQHLMAFLAIAGLGERERTFQRAQELMPSGQIRWGLDDEGIIWSLFAVGGTPTVVLVTGDDRILGAWAGAVGEEELRSRIEYLIQAEAGNQAPRDLRGSEEQTSAGPDR